ncbi:hypothetical protein J6590_052039 [Homalodisca vitripennis]|nr:hypothetical protein J6590_052039 [Homalodisca vitripennis]
MSRYRDKCGSIGLVYCGEWVGVDEALLVLNAVTSMVMMECWALLALTGEAGTKLAFLSSKVTGLRYKAPLFLLKRSQQHIVTAVGTSPTARCLQYLASARRSEVRVPYISLSSLPARRFSAALSLLIIL